ncbi:MAG: hypothetical protein LBD86_07340 [Spirochaetaceae bacterium]|nr:hypothetical protein [Spirochaetaceae bacterium]
MRNMAKFTLIITAVAVKLAGCTPGTIPVFTSDVYDFSLPKYITGENSKKMPANAEELYISRAYMTSDGITHIVLKGTIDNGIPEGLLWGESVVSYGTAPVGTYGHYTAGTYAGLGDFRIGTLAASTGGSLAIGSLDFSSEWMMAAPYSAVVINGLVPDIADVTVTETNYSLNLYSDDYRKDEKNGFFDSDGGIPQRVSRYRPDYKEYPNSFRTNDAKTADNKRGGYMVLISKHAGSATAMLDFDYKDGTSKRYEIDYGAVNFNEKTLDSLSFQSPTPDGTYIIGSAWKNRDPSYNLRLENSSSISVQAGNIYMDTTTGKPLKPLYLRPLYVPVKEAATGNVNPKDNTTNMIHRIWFEFIDNSTGYGRDNFTLGWDDVTQSITLYLNENAKPLESGVSVGIGIHAELREPYDDTEAQTYGYGTGLIREFMFTVEVSGP